MSDTHRLGDDSGVAQTVAGETGAPSGERSHAIDALDGLPRGRTIDRYVLVDRLGAGGMGVVYRAFDPDLDRSIALKLVSVGRGEAERARLLREAQAIAKLSHPNVIPVFDVGVEAGVVFVAMEMVDGVTLRRWCGDGERPWQEVLARFVDAGRGLAAAHAAGVIHRDFKPDNVMVGRDGRVRVLDFGLARRSEDSPTLAPDDHVSLEVSARARSTLGAPLSQSLTAEGAVLGTPAYMSPEQYQGMPALAASDQFSFCVALWEALFGQRPFAGDSVAALSVDVLQGRLREVPSSSRVPRRIIAALTRGLSTDDKRRHPSMNALLAALADGVATRRRRHAAVFGGALLLLAGGVAVGARMSGKAQDVGAAACTGSADALGETWNSERRAVLVDAFERTGLSYAPQVAATVAAAVDARADAWITARTAVCRATRVTGEQSEAVLERKMACLDRRRLELDALITAMAHADAAAIDRAIDAVAALLPASSCEADRTAEDALAGDPAVRAALSTLAHVQAAVALGRYSEARMLLGPLSVTASAGGGPRFGAAVRLWLGIIESDAGVPQRAREFWEQGFADAIVVGDDAAAAELAGRLALEVGYALADRRGGEIWLRIGRALVERQGGDADRAAELDAAEGATLVAAGQYAQAIDAHQRSLAHWQAIRPDGLEVARALADIGAADIRLGRLDAALGAHARALAIRTATYGADHPLVASSERELGMALSDAGRFTDAIVPLERALAIQRVARGPQSIAVATLLDDLGRAARHTGDLEAALARHREALVIWEKVLGDPHPDLAVSLLNVGYTLAAAGRASEAVEIDRRALAMFEVSAGAEHPYIVYACNALGAAALAADEPGEAIAPLERALGLRGKAEVDPTLFAETMFTLAQARWRTARDPSDRAAALAFAREAKTTYAAVGERWKAQIDAIDAWLAAPR